MNGLYAFRVFWGVGGVDHVILSNYTIFFEKKQWWISQTFLNILTYIWTGFTPEKKRKYIFQALCFLYAISKINIIILYWTIIWACLRELQSKFFPPPSSLPASILKAESLQVLYFTFLILLPKSFLNIFVQHKHLPFTVES